MNILLIILLIYLWIGLIWTLLTYIYRYKRNAISSETQKWYNVIYGLIMWPRWVYNFIRLYVELGKDEEVK